MEKKEEIEKKAMRGERQRQRDRQRERKNVKALFH